MIHRILPDDKTHWLKLRSTNINSTEVSALFGLSPYQTEFELYHRHVSELQVDFTETDRTRWGTRLQNSIAEGIAEDQGWEVREAKEYIYDDELKMGSSFDYMLLDKRYHDPKEDAAILEIKNVDGMAFRDGWIEDEEDGTIEAPPHIELQVQHQMALTGLKKAYIGAFIGGNKVVLIERDADDEIIESIRNKIKEFWQRVQDKNPPSPDFKHDMDVISKLYGYAAPGKVIESNEEINKWAKKYKRVSDVIKKLEVRKDEYKAHILTQIKDAEKVSGDLFSITASMVGPSSYEVNREGFRMFRINWRKAKSEKTKS